MLLKTAIRVGVKISEKLHRNPKKQILKKRGAPVAGKKKFEASPDIVCGCYLQGLKEVNEEEKRERDERVAERDARQRMRV